jgi:predicted ester cyclase
MERLTCMSIPITITRAQANRRLADNVVRNCFDPPRPEEFDRLASDERARFMFAAFAAAFPDARLVVDWVTADDRRVVVGGRVQATHSAPWRGIEATGRRVDVMNVASMTVVEGKVVDLTVVTDSLTVAEQIGAVQPLAPKACQVYEEAVRSSS